MEKNELAELFSALPWLPEWNNCMSGVFLWCQEPSSEDYFCLAQKDIYLGLEKMNVLLECVYKNKKDRRIIDWQKLLNWQKRLEFYANLFQLNVMPEKFIKNLDEKDNFQIKKFKVFGDDPKSIAMQKVYRYWSEAV
jgi:hypothetical protein